jgi:SMC interacting uncharacterized protein involved in chromosome segregation
VATADELKTLKKSLSDFKVKQEASTKDFSQSVAALKTEIFKKIDEVQSAAKEEANALSKTCADDILKLETKILKAIEAKAKEQEESALALSQSVTELKSQINEIQSSAVQEVQPAVEEPAAD